MSKNFIACDSINVVGTHFQGVVKTTYDKIVKVLGEPTSYDASPYEKVNASWSIEMKDEDKTVFTVYNCNSNFFSTFHDLFNFTAFVYDKLQGYLSNLKTFI